MLLLRTGTEGEGGGRAQVLQSGWHGGGWSRRGARASDGLALQGHHHVAPQLLGQGPPILDVVQPVDLPLVLDA